MCHTWLVGNVHWFFSTRPVSLQGHHLSFPLYHKTVDLACTMTQRVESELVGVLVWFFNWSVLLYCSVCLKKSSESIYSSNIRAINRQSIPRGMSVTIVSLKTPTMLAKFFYLVFALLFASLLSRSYSP